PRTYQMRLRGAENYVPSVNQLAQLERTFPDRLDREADVEVAAFHRVDELIVVRRLGDLDIDVRPALLEPSHYLRQHLVGDALVDADTQAARDTGRVGSEVRLRGAQARLDRLRMTQQHPPGFRELDDAPASRPLDEAHTDQRFQ